MAGNLDPLRIGFVGCGLIARHHAKNLANDRRARIVAVHDIDPERAESFASDHGHDGRAAVRPDAEAVIGDVDALYVCTWTGAHREPVLAAARTGRAVFCEKPLATGLAAATEMTKAVVEAGVTNQAGLILRRSPSFRVLRDLVGAPESGPIMNLVFRDDQYLPTQGMYGSTWRADAELAGGGTVLEHSIHDVDLIEWLLGPIVEVSARMGSVHGLAGIDDQATVVLMAESGAQAVLVSVWHDVLSRPSQRRVEVFTQGGFFSLAGDWSGPVHWDRSRQFEGGGPPGTVGELAGAPLAAQAERIDGLGTNPDQAFVTSVLTGEPAHPSLDDALRAHHLIDAAYRSATAGGAIVPVSRRAEVTR